MSSVTAIQTAPRSLLPAAPTRGLIRFLCTSNPFYVLSAALFLAGLWISFGGTDQVVQTGALMSGLAGYTLLLAVTACLLVRFGNVWDDVRTVLLLVVLLFLATSVTFDEMLISNPDLGFFLYLGGLLFALTVSEGILRAIRLDLPWLFRLPYYLILALFFLYPLALSPLVGDPHDEELLWGLFGFSTVAGLVFLTLLPAIRRGADYVHDNGSPWRWPLYPWVLFGLLALAVPARAFLLCWSMHLLTGNDRDSLIFGPYFVIPFGFALTILLLEIGLVSKARAAVAVALVAPLGLVALALIGHRQDPIYQECLDLFALRLGCDPLFLTLCATAAFYAYAARRGVTTAIGGLALALCVLAFVAPDSLHQTGLVAPQPLPIFLGATLLLTLAYWKRDSRWLLLGSGAMIAAVTLAVPPEFAAFQPVFAFHLVLIALFLLGAFLGDGLAPSLRALAALLALVGCVAVVFSPAVPPWARPLYPLGMAAVLIAYGLVLRHHFSLVAAGMILVAGITTGAWYGYFALRQVVSGLDHLALSLALFGVAVLISLSKAGVFRHWIGQEQPLPDAPITSVQLGGQITRDDSA